MTKAEENKIDKKLTELIEFQSYLSTQHGLNFGLYEAARFKVALDGVKVKTQTRKQ